MQKKIYKYIIIIKSKYILFPSILLYEIKIRWNFTYSKFKRLFILHRFLNMILEDNNIPKNKMKMNAYRKKSYRKNN